MKNQQTLIRLKIKHFILIIVHLLFLISCSVSARHEVETAKFCSKENSRSSNENILVEKYLEVGGIEQWVSIRGKNCNNPVILTVHGGPGSVLSHVTSDFYQKLEEHFVVVYWDQRGAGRTFGKHRGALSFADYRKNNPLSLERLITDGIEISDLLRKKLNRDKIVLLGSSWGAYLAMSMVKAKPEFYWSYVGNAQLVNAREKMLFGYAKSLEIAKSNQNKEVQNALLELGEPPYDTPKKNGQLIRIIKHYERLALKPSHKKYSLLHRHNNEIDRQNRMLGDDYSFMFFSGFKRIGIDGFDEFVDLNKLGYEVEVPIYLFQGAKDLVTPAHITQTYFDKLNAPVKALYIVPDSGHEPSDKMIDDMYKLLVRKILPAIAP